MKRRSAMKGTGRGWVSGMWVVLVAGIALGLGGCESTKHALGIGEPAPPPAPRYHDFPDVLVPPEIELDPKGSVVYESAGSKAGVLLFSGRVEVESLVDFFRKAMPRDGWTLVSSVRFNRILLNFSKPEKTCQILIWDKTMTTEVEIQVNPIKP
jgi:hypothetical protein